MSARPPLDPMVVAARQRWHITLTDGRTGRLVYAPGPATIPDTTRCPRSGRKDRCAVVIDGTSRAIPVDLHEIAAMTAPTVPSSRSRR